MSDTGQPETYEGTPAYEEGYADACEVTDMLISTLMEDVESYHRLYLRAMRQYSEHVAACSIKRSVPADQRHAEARG